MEKITTYLMQINTWDWFVLATILAITDVLLGANFFLIWCGLASVSVATIAFFIPHISWQYQFMLFGLFLMMSTIFWHHCLKTRIYKSSRPHLNNRLQQTIGRKTLLIAPIKNGIGKVNFDDTIWQLRGKDLPIGTQVQVVRVESAFLHVEEVI